MLFTYIYIYLILYSMYKYLCVYICVCIEPINNTVGPCVTSEILSDGTM